MKSISPKLLGATLILTSATISLAQEGWQPKDAPLMTRWARDVSQNDVHPEYPRPQLVRKEWKSLNGLWNYAITPRDAGPPERFDGGILVPFPVESALSGVMKRVAPDQCLWYQRPFTIPESWKSSAVLLNFEASDWETTVWVDGTRLSTHRGGYDPFSVDITPSMNGNRDEHTLLVRVWDPTDEGTQPRGKQVSNPQGIWYTPTTGIWQTVWIEPVPQARSLISGSVDAGFSWIDSLKITPSCSDGTVRIGCRVLRTRPGAEPSSTAPPPHERFSGTIEAVISAQGKIVAEISGSHEKDLVLKVPTPRLWSPGDPFLYDLLVRLHGQGSGGEKVCIDEVESYFGFRDIALGRDDDGIMRLMLNGQPLFQLGLLDQGFWPDGLYTAPTDEALRYDLEITKRLGFNMIRKHVKVEPRRWYHWCDKLGILVWQDMPSGDRSPGQGEREIQRSTESARQFELELQRMVENLHNHPSIVMWVPFNEAWGQYDTRRIAEWLQGYDPTRLVNSASGWHDHGVGHVHDIHAYPGPASPRPEPTRAAVLGEFGGLGLPLPGHTWQDRESWGYRSFERKEDLNRAYLELLDRLRFMRADPGLSAAVYTQTTDVETEVNGVMTYDRAEIKLVPESVRAANERLYAPPPDVRPLLPTSEEQPATWRFTTDQQPEDWFAEAFEDSTWPTAPAPFGREGTPGVTPRTAWHTPDVWMRRTFELKRLPSQPYLSVFHDEDCEIYVNGVLAAAPRGYTTSYAIVPMADASSLRIGMNLLAVHCHQTGGGQGIDVGIVDVIEPHTRTGEKPRNSDE